MKRNIAPLFMKMFFSSPVPMTIASKKDDVVVEANDAFCTTVGYSRAELIGHTGFALNLIDSRSKSKIFQKLHGSEPLYNVEIEARSKSGRALFLLTSSIDIKVNGETFTAAFMLDITDRKQAEQALHKERKQSEQFIQTQRDLALALNAAVSLDETLRVCTETAIKISGMDCGGVYLVDEISGSLHLAYHQGLPERFIKQISHFEAGASNTKLVMAGKRRRKGKYGTIWQKLLEQSTAPAH